MAHLTHDLGLSRRDLENYLIRVGYWDTAHKRIRHMCILSPMAYILREETALTATARAIHAAVQKLEDELIALSRAKQPGREAAQWLGCAKTASGGLLYPGQAFTPGIPPILKVDMVRDREGRWHVVEVDSYNARALGTIALCDWLLEQCGLAPYASIGDNLVRCLGGETSLTVVVSAKEGYYRTSFELVRLALEQRGVRVRLITEQEIAMNPTIFAGSAKPQALLVIPDNLHRHPTARHVLLSAYREGRIALVYPPKPYLGSKAFLPFLASQEGVLGSIPPTALLVGTLEQCDFSPCPVGKRVLLKPVTSSGSKGIVEQDDTEAFYRTINESRGAKNPLWVAQEEIEQGSVPITVFTDDDRKTDLMFNLRLTMYVSAEGIAGIKMTGREHKIVHGAADCVQLPVMRVPRA